MTPARSSGTPLYSTLGSDPELADIVEMFVAEMPERVANFWDLLSKGNSEELRRAAHQLKGAAGSYGFEPITDAAAQLEIAVKTSQPEVEIRQAVEELTALCESARGGVSD